MTLVNLVIEEFSNHQVTESTNHQIHAVVRGAFGDLRSNPPAYTLRPMPRLVRALLFFLSGSVLLSLVLFLPVFPWAPRCQHTLNRAITKTKMRFYRWRGQEPRLVSLTGRTGSPGAEVY